MNSIDVSMSGYSHFASACKSSRNATVLRSAELRTMSRMRIVIRARRVRSYPYVVLLHQSSKHSVSHGLKILEAQKISCSTISRS